MKKKLSLRWRLTLITSLLLTLTCGLFTAFSFYNAGKNVVASVAAQIVAPAGSEGEGSSLTKAMETTPAMEAVPLTLLSNAVAPAAPFGWYSFIFMGAAILAGSAGMYALCGIALKPAKRLAEEISQIDRDNLSFRIEDFQGGDELESISHSFNRMMERVETAFLRETRFSAAAAHELKTPLTVIQTNLDVLAMDEEPTPEDYAASVRVVRNQTERMNTLVSQLTLLAGAGEMPDEETVDLKKTVEEIQSELEMGTLSLRMELSPVSVTGSAVLLKHACSNLIHNAIRYNVEHGSVLVSLSREGASCQFVVKDTGIGVGEEDAAHLFEPFYRADKSRSRRLGGTGLGLSIVKEIAERHGGSVSYRKNTPKGSVFTMVLPLGPKKAAGDEGERA